jgi:hypothetical protein
VNPQELLVDRLDVVGEQSVEPKGGALFGGECSPLVQERIQEQLLAAFVDGEITFSGIGHGERLIAHTRQPTEHALLWPGAKSPFFGVLPGGYSP